MGNHGYNADGFAYMNVVACPLCGRKHHVGSRKFHRGDWECGNSESCKQKQEKNRAALAKAEGKG
jgi:hypothetical protein